MSGLPGAGKDTWLRRRAPELPVISLDSIREELDAPSTGDQGSVIQAARDRARQLLREGVSFAWSATNLSRDRRGQLIDLFTAYRARTRIVYVEAPNGELFERNAKRQRPVPIDAIEHMLDHWQVPDVTEAWAVEWWQSDMKVDLSSTSSFLG